MVFTGQRSAIQGKNARNRRTRKIVPPTTTAICSPEIDSRCASPASRIACATGSGTPPWSPVTNAAAIAPGAPGTAAPICVVNRARACASHADSPEGGGAGSTITTVPTARPVAPMP